jgi:hypothetical protein
MTTTLIVALACARSASSGSCPDSAAAWQALPALASPEHLFALSSTAAWVMGPKLFLAWDGCAWRAQPPPPDGGDRSPQGLWASGPRDVWTVMSEPFHYRPDPRREDHLRLIQPRQPAEIWRWNGERWSRLPIPEKMAPERLTALSGFSADDVWVAGHDAARPPTPLERPMQACVLRWDGQRFRRVDLPTANVPKALWGASPAELWIGGQRWLQRLPGLDRPPDPPVTPAPDFDVERIWGRSAQDAWAAGLGGAQRWDGWRWSPVPVKVGSGGSTTALRGPWGAGSRIFGTAGSQIFSLEASGWVPAFEVRLDRRTVRFSRWAVPEANVWLGPVALAGADDGWALGRIDERPALLRWDGRRWRGATPLADEQVGLIPQDTGPPWAIRSARTVAPGEPSGTVYRPPAADRPLQALPFQPLGTFTSGRDSVWIVGTDAGARHFDGTRWENVATGARSSLLAVWEAPGHAEVWAAGVDLVHRRRDGTWETCPPTSWGVHALWGSAADDLWAASESGFQHWDGEEWLPLFDAALIRRRRYTAETVERGARRVSVAALWGGGRDDVWAVGAGQAGAFAGQAFVAHWDGARWSEAPLCHLPAADRRALQAIWGRGAADVWAVGRGGTLLHWDGRAWWAVPSGTRGDLLAVAGAAGGGLWVAGVGVEPLLVQPAQALAEIARRPTPDPTACDLPLRWEVPPVSGDAVLAFAAHKAEARDCLARHGGQTAVGLTLWRERDGSVRVSVPPATDPALARCLAEIAARVKVAPTAFEGHGSSYTLRARAEGGCVTH